jgi:hypothetical protein
MKETMSITPRKFAIRTAKDVNNLYEDVDVELMNSKKIIKMYLTNNKTNEKVMHSFCLSPSDVNYKAHEAQKLARNLRKINIDARKDQIDISLYCGSQKDK